MKMWLQIRVVNKEIICSGIRQDRRAQLGQAVPEIDLNQIFAKEETPIFKDNENNNLAALPVLILFLI